MKYDYFGRKKRKRNLWKFLILLILCAGLGIYLFQDSLVGYAKDKIKGVVKNDTISVSDTVYLTKPTLQKDTLKIPMEVDQSGTITVIAKINSVPVRFLLDTGCSGVLLGAPEYLYLVRNKFMTDRLDSATVSHSVIADGSTMQNLNIKVDSISFGGITLKDIEVSVPKDEKPMSLLGQSVLGRLGTLQLDYTNKQILIIK